LTEKKIEVVENFTVEDSFDYETLWVFQDNLDDLRNDSIRNSISFGIKTAVFNDNERDEVRSALKSVTELSERFNRVVVKSEKKGKTIEDCFDRPEDIPILTDDQIIDLACMRLDKIDPLNREVSYDYIYTLHKLAWETVWRHDMESQPIKCVALVALVDKLEGDNWLNYSEKQYREAANLLRQVVKQEKILVDKARENIEVLFKG
jgi:hypothetical protein